MANKNKIIDVDRLTRYHGKINGVLSAKQDVLVSGYNIKTINNVPIIGSGNINIGSKEMITFDTSTITLSPNIYYRKTNQSSTLDISLSPETNGVLNEYLIEFTTSTTGTTILLPNTIKWANGETPSFDAGSTYQISIVNNLGVCIKFA